jgi:hypothetical protein
MGFEVAARYSLSIDLQSTLHTRRSYVINEVESQAGTKEEDKFDWSSVTSSRTETDQESS